MTTKTQDSEGDWRCSSSVLEDLVFEVSELAEAGKVYEANELIEQHPEYADRLNRLLPAIAALATLDKSVQDSAETHAFQSLGDFRILREIGRGGMGVVYEAEQLSLGRRVALKVLPLAATLSPQQLERFKNEARAAATLKHSHIVGVYSVGVERGVHYYAMELVEGQTLPSDRRPQSTIGGRRRSCAGGRNRDRRGLVDRAAKSPQKYFRQMSRLMADAADALDYAHNRGVLHRDIKPANLMIDSQSHVWVTDFGLARLETDAGVTLTGDILGTLRYMSPEQAAGKSALVDYRTDIHALGATLFELSRFGRRSLAKTAESCSAASPKPRHPNYGRSTPACPSTSKPSSARRWRKSPPIVTNLPARWPPTCGRLPSTAPSPPSRRRWPLALNVGCDVMQHWLRLQSDCCC